MFKVFNLIYKLYNHECFNVCQQINFPGLHELNQPQIFFKTINKQNIYEWIDYQSCILFSQRRQHDPHKYFLQCTTHVIWIHIEWAALLKTMWLSYDFKVKTRNPSHILWFFTVNEWTAHSLITVDNCLQVVALYTLAIGAVLLFLNISICEKIHP